MSQPFEIDAPDYFIAKVERAEQLLKEYQLKYPQFYIDDSFTISPIGEKRLFKLSEEKQALVTEDILCAKYLSESLWQLAYKEIYFLIPETRRMDISYDPETKKITRMFPNMPVITKEENGTRRSKNK